MELDQIYDNFSLWEPDFGLPEGIWTEELLDVKQGQSGIGHITEGDSFWKEDYNPLKEASNAIVSERLHESFSLDVSNDFGNDVWLDEKTDIGSLLDNLIQSQEFDEVLSNLDDSESYLKSMELAEEPAEIIAENPSEVKVEDISVTDEASSDSNVEIEADELSLQNTVVIYIEPSDPCEVSLPLNDHILADINHNEAAILSSVSTTIKNEFMHIDNISGTEIIETSELPGKNAAFNELPSTSELCTKSKRGRKKTRTEPYKNVWTKSNASSTCSSAPVSPSSVDTYDDSSDTQMPTTSKRKERKKYQNRNAATKYRQKKRAETEAISTEEQALETKNKELKETVQSLETEINYLKGFMREIMAARGLIKI